MGSPVNSEPASPGIVEGATPSAVGNDAAVSTRPEAGGAEPPRASRRLRLTLLLAIAGFVVLLTVLSELRAVELWSTTWDLGIYQQALWSTAHGRAFFENPDLETGGFGSYLQVHSALVLYAVVPLYALAPTPLTLFAVQSVVVAAAAIPLFALARAKGAEPRWALGVAVLYLLWAPTIGGTLYDFHIEAFVPIVYLTTALYWVQRRTGRAAVATLVGFLTMEVVPVFTFFLAVFLLLEGLHHRRPIGPGRRLRDRLRSGIARLLERELWGPWALLVASGVAYGAMLVLRQSLLHDWFGFPAYPSTLGSGYVTGGSLTGLGLSVSFLSLSLFVKLSYWALAFALLAFAPLLYPRSLVLIVPWFAFTLFSPVPNYVTFGFQYWLLAAGPLFVGVVFALPRVQAAQRVLAATGRPRTAAPPRPRWRRGPSVTGAAVVGLLLVNIAFSPVNPWFPYTTPGSAYQITYTNTTSAESAVRLAALIPPGAEVLASDDLFPLVANDLNAYSLLWVQDPNLTLPFDLYTLPQFVLLSEYRLPAVPPFLTSTLYDPARFGVRGVAWTSPTGPDLLFERHYSGPLAQYGAVPDGNVIAAPRELFSATGVVQLRSDASVPGGVYLATLSGAIGLVWNGPSKDFAPGNYTVVATVRAVVAPGATGPASDDPVVTIAAGEFAEPSWFVRTLTYSELAGPGWHQVSWSVHVAEPTLTVTWPGYALDPNVEIDLVEIQSTPSP